MTPRAARPARARACATGLSDARLARADTCAGCCVLVDRIGADHLILKGRCDHRLACRPPDKPGRRGRAVGDVPAERLAITPVSATHACRPVIVATRSPTSGWAPAARGPSGRPAGWPDPAH